MGKQKNYALVTGASGGIGFEIAKLLAKDGHNLIIAARGKEDLELAASKLKSEGNIKVVVFAKDLFNRQAAFELYDLVNAHDIELDILVNNAGQGLYGEFKDTDIQRELNIIELNIMSLVVLTKLFVKDMVARGSGRILNLSSVASKSPGPFQSVYHGTKAFVQSFTEAIRDELKDTGVTVTALLPGATDTDFFRKAGMLDAKNVKEGKLMPPAEVAKDGYDAMMNGDDMIVSGFKNKMMVGMSAITPDAMAAAQTHKSQEPVSKEEA